MHFLLFRFSEEEGLKSKVATELNIFYYCSVSVKLEIIYKLMITYNSLQYSYLGIPLVEEPGGLQSMGLLGVGHN